MAVSSAVRMSLSASMICASPFMARSPWASVRRLASHPERTPYAHGRAPSRNDAHEIVRETDFVIQLLEVCARPAIADRKKRGRARGTEVIERTESARKLLAAHRAFDGEETA